MTQRLSTRSLLIGMLSAIGMAIQLTPGAALAQTLIGETSARFDWGPAAGDVHFYEVLVSRSTRGGNYEIEQTVTSPSVVVDAGVGEVVRVRVRAGNDTSYGPLSLPSNTVRFGLPPELPVIGTPGVFHGRVSGSDSEFIFYANPTTGDVWRFSTIDASAPATLIGNETDPDWDLFASGDFDGDDVGDLFWRHTAGATRIWFLQGDTYQEEMGPAHPGAQWLAEITGDFDGNGQDDVLWREDTGAVEAWFRAGTQFTTTAFPAMPSDLELLSAGDYDGDGIDDVIWRDLSNVETLIWFMSMDPYNGSYARVRASERRSLLWEIFESFDENGDGIEDIHWRMGHSHDVTEWWLMNGEIVTTAL